MENVEISTQSAIKEMVAGLVAILSPVIIGLGGNYLFPRVTEMLGGLLAGVTSRAYGSFSIHRGAWDNAKKMVRKDMKSMDPSMVKDRGT